ncbi:MAG: hypothetical protein M3126_01140 [Candidatus Eremiobacteraeota bacterium]|nr:hypothetical protein [Candidatus Eremiobacteraeota bacterium]
MNARAGLVVMAALLALRGLAIAAPATADWAGVIRSLSADGVIQGMPSGKLSRAEMALLTARALARVQASGASKDDEARVAALSNEFHNELDLLGVRDQSVSQGRASLEKRTQAARSLRITGEFSAATDRGTTLEVVAPGSAHLQNFALQAGTLSQHPNSIAGLALGARSPIQPLLRGVSFSGTANGLSDFYFSVARMDRNFYYTPGVAAGPSSLDENSFALAPQTGSYIEFGPRNVVTGRFSQRLRNAPDASIGVTYNHIFGSSAASGLVSNTVFGMDLSVPMLSRSGLRPAVYAEAASSASSITNIAFAPASRFDNALVAGIKFHVRSVLASVQYQTVGPNFVDGPRVSGGFFGAATAGLQPQPPPTLAPHDAGVATFTAPGYPAFDPFEDAAPASFSAYVPNTQGLKVELSAPVRIGAATVQGNFSAARLQELTRSNFSTAGSGRATDDRISAGTTFDVRALGRPIALNLGGSYEHILRNDATASSYVPYDPQAQGPDPGQILAAPPGLGPAAFNPNVVDVTRRSLNAAAAVPLARNLRLNLQYNTQFYTGSYSALGQNIDGRKDFYLGNLTYAIPRTSSAITFSAKQFRYRDSLLPTANLTQNRADLNFTVKF